MLLSCLFYLKRRGNCNFILFDNRLLYFRKSDNVLSESKDFIHTDEYTAYNLHFIHFYAKQVDVNFNSSEKFP